MPFLSPKNAWNKLKIQKRMIDHQFLTLKRRFSRCFFKWNSIWTRSYLYNTCKRYSQFKNEYVSLNVLFWEDFHHNSWHISFILAFTENISRFVILWKLVSLYKIYCKRLQQYIVLKTRYIMKISFSSLLLDLKF